MNYYGFTIVVTDSSGVGHVVRRRYDLCRWTAHWRTHGDPATPVNEWKRQETHGAGVAIAREGQGTPTVQAASPIRCCWAGSQSRA
jgi:hypothetical protein